MKIRNLILTILMIVIISAFAGCTNKNATSVNLNTPDKINMYVDEKQKQIAKNSSDYDKTLFDRVYFLINVRLPKDFSAMQGGISDNDIKNFKGYSVEFIYDKEQTTTIDNKIVKFKEIVFPLSEKWQNTAFIKTSDNFYNGVGLKENLDYLVKSAVK